jgi:hypothetical protein
MATSFFAGRTFGQDQATTLCCRHGVAEKMSPW